MILSRFWYFVLTVVAVFGFATALLASNLVNEQWERSATNDLVRDRFEVEATLKLDARARLDAIAPIAANGDVRSALRRASGRRAGQEVDGEISEGLTTKLTELNGQLEGLRGDLLFAVDKDGWIVAAVGQNNVPDGAGLGSFPLVRRALEGHVRDDVWVYNDQVYRMAARPVIDGGQYVGALVHGKRFDDQLAELLSTRLDGASVAFFRGETAIAGHMASGAPGAVTRDEMASLLAGPEGVLAAHSEALDQGHRTDPQEIERGGLAIFSLVTGTARTADVGYAIGRPVRSLERPIDILDQVSGEAWSELPWEILGPAAALVFLFSMFLVWFEHDRPLSKLLKAAGGVAAEQPQARFVITDFGGRYRRTTEAMNEALERMQELGAGAGPKRQAANLDQILGPTADEQAGGGGFFGFAADDEPAPDFGAIPEAPAPAPAGGLPSPAGALPATPAGALPSLGSPAAPSPPARPTPPAAAPKPPAPKAPPRPPAPPTPPARRPAPEATASAEEDELPTMIAAPPSSQRKALKRTLLGVPPASADDDDDDGATMVARVPRELLEASASSNEEDRHFREVFEKFVDLKKKCGEPVTGLTFAKFSVTLRKNRDQIVKRHGASKVRFTVYEKNGKAALKATPIKD